MHSIKLSDKWFNAESDNDFEVSVYENEELIVTYNAKDYNFKINPTTLNVYDKKTEQLVEMFNINKM